MLNRRLVVAAGLVCAALQLGSAQEPQAPAAPAAGQAQEQPTFREAINFVRVDVIVTDGKQQPVTDLTIDDFEVLEDGKPQQVEQFRFVRIDGNVEPGAAPPREIRSRNDEETEAANGGRPAVRCSSSTTTTSPARQFARGDANR